MKNLASFRQFREEGLMTEWGDTLQAVRVPGSPPQIGGDTQALSGNAPTPLNYTPNDLKDPRVIDDINNHLERKLDDAFLTPYIGLERMRKVLHPYGIVIPAVTWLNGDEGDKVFTVNQYSGFGDLTAHSNHVVYMSWSYVPDKGHYDIYAAVVTIDQLDSLLATDNDGTPFDDQDVEEDEMAEAFKLSKPSSGVDKFMDDYHATTHAHPWDNNTRLLHNTMVKAFPHGEEIHLSDIQTMAPKSGAGTKALEHLKSLADKHGVAISGAAVPYAKDKKYITTKKTLNKFYADRGFAVKGENIKYSPKAQVSEACWDDYKQVGMKKKNGKTVPNCVPEESAAWQRKEGKNPEGGLNQKGVDSYRRENPGSKLKTAVTTPPSKLDPDSKSAKRRKSFCARMGGVEGPMKDDKGRPTRKALSLRKWNCNEEIKKPTAKEKHEAAIAKLLAYAPHLTREQAIKQIGYDKELDKQAKAKSKMQRGVFGIK